MSTNEVIDKINSLAKKLDHFDRGQAIMTCESEKIRQLYAERDELKSIISSLKKLKTDIGGTHLNDVKTGTQTVSLGLQTVSEQHPKIQSLLDYLETTPIELSGFVSEAEDIIRSLRCLLLGESQ